MTPLFPKARRMAVLWLAAALPLTTVVPIAAPVHAQGAEVAVEAEGAGKVLAAALRLDELFAVLRDEGLAAGVEMESDMFPAGGGKGWATALDRIYDAPALLTAFVEVLDAELAQEPDVVADIAAFFSSDIGKRVVGLEI
jgi:hypothetical protein